MKLLRGMILLGLASTGASGLALAEAPAGTAAPVYGTVSACYYSTNCPFANVLDLPRAPSAAEGQRDGGEHPVLSRAATPGASTPVDAPAFQFTNTGTAPITGARFEILQDKNLGIVHDQFYIDTIAPGASFVIVPGASNDNRAHEAGAFFAYSGAALDTSDTGPNEDSIVFRFNGVVNGVAVSTGKIRVGASAGPSGDLTVSKINFLGGPGNADGPCGDCFDPKVIGHIAAGNPR